MPCPFPGMDPYIERPDIWPDFHDKLITHISDILQPLLRPKYVAVVQDRLYVAETDRIVRPDVTVAKLQRPTEPRSGAVAVLAPDPAHVFELEDEEVREPFIHIVDVKRQSRVVTAIEVLSPKNKRPGPGSKSYLQKRQELWAGGANLVEIDLLRAGRATAGMAPGRLQSLQPFHYMVVVTRRKTRRQEVYTATIRQRLPRPAIPLGKTDPDVTLDLQAAFSRCWAGGPYPELLRYGAAPPGRLDESDVAWCVNLLRKKQLR
jgi:hypothetical protein